MPKFYGPNYEKARRKENPLKRDVLRNLKEHGARNYDLLYAHFDLHRTGDIAPILRDLLEWESIKRTGDNIEITEAGLRLLEDDEYWR
ncbi:MAG: hypothetical protein AABZ34_16215 [Nitrospirota bacterium]|mgnify:CR=1 FL=1